MPFASLAGGTRVVANYAAELVSRGHQVTVVSQPGLPAWKRFQMRLRRFGKDTHPKPTPLLDVPGLRHIILDRQRPVTDADLPDADAVIATWWETAEWVARVSPAKGRKFHFLQGYEMFPHQPLDRVAASFHLPLRKFAVSGYIRDIVLQNHGLDGISVLPNPIDLSLFNAPPRSRNLRLRVGLLYNIAAYKNLGLALDAITAAQMRCPDLEGMAFGEIPVDKRYPLPKGIRYRQRPPQAQIAAIYAACDLWLFTSRNEGFGLPLLEAMACRTPVLATHAGAAPDLIDGRNGILLEPDPNAFAAEIARFHAMADADWRAFSDAAWNTTRNHCIRPATDRLLAILNAD